MKNAQAGDISPAPIRLVVCSSPFVHALRSVLRKGVVERSPTALELAPDDGIRPGSKGWPSPRVPEHLAGRTESLIQLLG